MHKTLVILKQNAEEPNFHVILAEMSPTVTWSTGRMWKLHAAVRSNAARTTHKQAKLIFQLWGGEILYLGYYCLSIFQIGLTEMREMLSKVCETQINADYTVRQKSYNSEESRYNSFLNCILREFL